MVIKYDVDINNDAIKNNIDRLTNQIFKLLPGREEGSEWKTPLQNIILEIVGISRLLQEYHEELFLLLSKLEALLTLTEDKDFLMFRKTIFECLGIMNGIKKCL